MVITGRSTRALRIGLGLGWLLMTESCVATVGVNAMSVPADAAQTCERHCQTIGMHLSAVAIMAENVGCVCQFAASPKPGAGSPAALEAPTAGMAAIAVQASTASQRERRQQQSGAH